MNTPFATRLPEHEKKTRIVIVDDHVGLRQMLALVLRMEPGMELVGEASGGCEALKLCRELKPDLVILDLGMKDLAGTFVLRGIREGNWGARVLIYTGTENEKLVQAALRAEPDGFLHKTADLGELRAALHTLAAGGQYIPVHEAKLRAKLEAQIARLSEKELAVLQMVSGGMFTKEIAEILGLSAKAVDHHRQHLMDKLGMHDVASLTKFAMLNGMA